MTRTNKGTASTGILGGGISFARVILVLGGLGFLIVFGYAIWASFQPEQRLGEEFPIASRQHIPDGTTATDYNSDPPTSGQHYDTPALAGFYDDAIPDEQLVHNLEHGYVVIYYNCSNLTADACQNLKAQIQNGIDRAGLDRFTQSSKLIAVPRPAMADLITYTSWGRLYRADQFGLDQFLQYVEENRSQPPAPEFNVP